MLQNFTNLKHYNLNFGNLCFFNGVIIAANERYIKEIIYIHALCFSKAHFLMTDMKSFN